MINFETILISKFSGTVLDSYPFSQRMDALETSIDARYQFALNYLNVQVISHFMLNNVLISLFPV